MSTIRSLPSYTEPGRSPSLSVELSIYATFTKREILVRHVSSSDFPENLNQHLNQRSAKPARLGHLLTKKKPKLVKTQKNRERFYATYKIINNITYNKMQ